MAVWMEPSCRFVVIIIDIYYYYCLCFLVFIIISVLNFLVFRYCLYSQLS